MENCKIFLEPEDHPPPSYFTRNPDHPYKYTPFQTPAPEDWVKAPEFVPRGGRTQPPYIHRGYENPFSFEDPINSIPFTPCTDLMPRTAFPLDGIPPGYSANITNINTGTGPPIPAILLRKKRKRRNRQSQTNSMIINNHSSSPESSHPSDPNGFGSEDEPETIQNNVKGSCPDLSKDQLEAWDDYLYQTAQEHNEREDNNNLRKGKEVYDNIDLDRVQQGVDGIGNDEIRKVDRETGGEGNITTSQVLKRLSSYSLVDSDASPNKSLASEFEQLNFRPTMNRYGYPQIDSNRVHVTTSDGYGGSIRDVVIDTDILQNIGDDENYVEDYIEGLNITVNQFDDCEDLTLSDVEPSSNTRFHHIQRAMKNNVQVYTELRAPDRVCCLIM